jgi:feruloyl esterase
MDGRSFLNNCDVEVLRDEKIVSEGGKYSAAYFLLISRPTDSSYIRSQIWLPDNYNGIFLGLGGGGMAGNLIEEAPWDYLCDGYAVGYTDMGTSRYVSGEEMRADIELWRDYTWRSTHVMTELAKNIIKNYYGEEPRYSYFFGESAGGLQAYSEAERFPMDYDGIVAGVSSHNALNLIVYFLWLHRSLRDETGRALISKDVACEISLKAREYFKLHGDGEPNDDFISYPYVAESTVDDFLLFLASSMPSLSKKQIDALRLAYNGPIHSVSGEQLFAGLPIGSEMNSGFFTDSKDFGFTWFKWLFGDGYSDNDFDFGAYYDKLIAELGCDFSAVSCDLNAFNEHGGKFISYVGTADPAGPWAEALKHYNSLCERSGGFDSVKSFFKLFLLPGRGHNKRHGLGLRLPLAPNGEHILSALRVWREKGEEPSYIIGSHIETSESGTVVKDFSRKILPYQADKLIEGRDFPRCTSDRILEAISQV